MNKLLIGEDEATSGERKREMACGSVPAYRKTTTGRTIGNSSSANGLRDFAKELDVRLPEGTQRISYSN